MPSANNASTNDRAPTSLIVGAAVSWLLVTGTLAFGMAEFEALFRDRGIALPALTRSCISLAHWLNGTGAGRSFPGWIIAGIPWLAILIGPAILGVLPSTRSYGRPMLKVVRIALLVPVLLIAGAIVLPLAQSRSQGAAAPSVEQP